MTAFDSLVDDVGDRFHLGTKSEPLMRHMLQFITGGPGGIGGFLDRMKSTGLGSMAASWLGNTTGTALSSQQVETAFGHSAINGIASKLGLGFGAVSGAMGYLLPKLIGMLTPGGKVPTGIPAQVTSFLESGSRTTRFREEQLAPPSMTVIKERERPRRSSWLIPLALAIGAGVLMWSVFSNTPVDVVTREAPDLPRTAAIPAPEPAPALSTPKPAFDLSDLMGSFNRTIINFRTGSAELSSASRAWLASAAGMIKQLPSGTVIEIGGHTDTVGNEADNMKLSQERADAVRQALVTDGVSPDSLKAVGYGSNKPVASNDSAMGRSRNRRIEFATASG